MSTELFKSSEASAHTPPVRFTYDGRELSAPAGTSLAAALLLNGIRQFRTTPVRQAPRAPYCMMGVCFDCLVEVDGRPSVQSCLLAVRDGMDVRSQQGASELALADGEPSHG